MSQEEHDERWMREALTLARLGRATCRPNPMVGAVIVKDGERIAQGYHAVAGGPHAEVAALAEAGEAARGSTVYVNLEPCSHHGRTPPCADALMQAGVARVVAGMIDPNPKVSGRGLARLAAAGIQTRVGVLEDACLALNEAFVAQVRDGRPLVTLKLACSLDGRIATRTGDSRWITGEEARREVHALRADADAILVGTSTAELDDPALTVRDAPLAPHGAPLRVVLDRTLRLPADRRLWEVSHARTLVMAGPGASPASIDALQSRGVEVATVALGADGRLSLAHVLQLLADRDVQRLLVEGGAEVAGSLLDASLVDRVIVHQAPMLIGGRQAPVALGGLGPATLSDLRKPLRVERRTLGADAEVVLHYRPPFSLD